ncbi:MAG: PAS domain-containing protein, partial [Promethearchaeota archaeon]
MNKSLTTFEEKDKNFYRSFIEGKGKNFIAFVAQAGQLKYVNETIEELLGYSPQEVLASNFDIFSLISPKHRRMAQETYLKRLKDSSIPPKAEITLLTKANKKLPAILYAEIIEYQGRKAIQGLIVDISERKKIERELKHKKERYRRLLEESPNLIVNINESGQIHYINRTFLDILGADNFEDNFEGRPFWTLIASEH